MDGDPNWLELLRFGAVIHDPAPGSDSRTFSGFDANGRIPSKELKRTEVKVVPKRFHSDLTSHT
jgi:hypothetical protein